jgi:hypothetical protein
MLESGVPLQPPCSTFTDRAFHRRSNCGNWGNRGAPRVASSDSHHFRSFSLVDCIDQFASLAAGCNGTPLLKRPQSVDFRRRGWLYNLAPATQRYIISSFAGCSLSMWTGCRQATSPCYTATVELVELPPQSVDFRRRGGSRLLLNFH